MRIATDRELMVRVQADDNIALGLLYDRLAGRAMSVARSMCRDATLAADSVQDAFLSMWRSWARYRPELGEVAAWALGIVRNRCIDALRRNDRHTRQVDLGMIAEPAAGDDVHQDLTGRHAATHLRGQLAALPLAQREVIVLAYYGKLTQTEIAHRLDIPIGTVKSRTRLGLDRLRAQDRPPPSA